MSVYLPQPPFTMEDVKEARENHRCVEFSKDEFGNIYEISWKEPCEICGKYHNLFSKAQKKCSLKMAAIVYSIMTDCSLNHGLPSKEVKA